MKIITCLLIVANEILRANRELQEIQSYIISLQNLKFASDNDIHSTSSDRRNSKAKYQQQQEVGDGDIEDNPPISPTDLVGEKVTQVPIMLGVNAVAINDDIAD